MKNFLLLLTAAICLLSCKKGGEHDCQALKTALLAGDEASVKRLINELIPSFDRQVTATDQTGFKIHFDILIDKLKSCDMAVTYACYSCVATYPPISEVSLQVTAGNQRVERSIDLRTDPHNNRFSFLSMH